MSTTGSTPPSPGEVDWKLCPEFAHPRARNLFREPFFWDAIDDHAPWGSDEGADALVALARAPRLPAEWRQFISEYVGSRWSNSRLHEGIDEPEMTEFNAGQIEVIAIALGMYLLHGYVPSGLKSLGTEAIERELQPCFLALFGEPDQRARKLKVCRELLQQVEEGPGEARPW